MGLQGTTQVLLAKPCPPLLTGFNKCSERKRTPQYYDQENESERDGKQELNQSRKAHVEEPM